MLGAKAGTCFRPTYVAAHRSRLEEIYVWIQIARLFMQYQTMKLRCQDSEKITELADKVKVLLPWRRSHPSEVD